MVKQTETLVENQDEEGLVEAETVGDQVVKSASEVEQFKKEEE